MKSPVKSADVIVPPFPSETPESTSCAGISRTGSEVGAASQAAGVALAFLLTLRTVLAQNLGELRRKLLPHLDALEVELNWASDSVPRRTETDALAERLLSPASTGGEAEERSELTEAGRAFVEQTRREVAELMRRACERATAAATDARRELEAARLDVKRLDAEASQWAKRYGEQVTETERLRNVLATVEVQRNEAGKRADRFARERDDFRVLLNEADSERRSLKDERDDARRDLATTMHGAIDKARELSDAHTKTVEGLERQVDRALMQLATSQAVNATTLHVNEEQGRRLKLALAALSAVQDDAEECSVEPAVLRQVDEALDVLREPFTKGEGGRKSDDDDGTRSFKCIGCGKLANYDEGGADDMPDHCADCWCAAHPEEAGAPVLDGEPTHDDNGGAS